MLHPLLRWIKSLNPSLTGRKGNERLTSSLNSSTRKKPLSRIHAEEHPAAFQRGKLDAVSIV